MRERDFLDFQLPAKSLKFSQTPYTRVRKIIYRKGDTPTPCCTSNQTTSDFRVQKNGIRWPIHSMPDFKYLLCHSRLDWLYPRGLSAIQSPGSDVSEIYRNRKGHFSVNVQLVCDRTGYISDVVANWSGSVHDSIIFDNSSLRAKFETEELKGCLIGDSGYACRHYMLTPVGYPTMAGWQQKQHSTIPMP